MAERNLENISANYPILSCYDLLEHRKKLDQTLPRSGMGKGYLPEERSLQQKDLQSVIDDRLNTLLEQRAARNHDLTYAEWDPVRKRAHVTKYKGKFMQSAGEIINGKRILYPEEVLFLMEASALELHFNGAIQSIQEAYRLLLNEEMSVEKFQVYSHLRRIGYIVVRHKKRSNDSLETKHKEQPEDVYDKSSRENASMREHISQSSQKYFSENKYSTTVHTGEEKIHLKIGGSTKIESKHKSNSYFRCLWKGINIPNTAGKRFLELEIPSLQLFPKNVCPQKQHYIIDVNASKNEVELGDDSNYHKYYEYACNNMVGYSENHSVTDSQNYDNNNDYNTFNTSYNSRTDENLNAEQFKNVSQDDHYFNQAVNEAHQHIMPSTSYENKKIDSFPCDIEMQTQTYNIDQPHTQDYMHNVHDNWNNTNKSLEEDYFNDKKTNFGMLCNKADSSSSEKHDCGVSHALDYYQISPFNYKNNNHCASYAEHRKQKFLCCKIDNSSFNQYECSYEASGNLVHNSSCNTASSNNMNQYSFDENDRNTKLTQFQNQNKENADAKCGKKLDFNYKMHDFTYTHSPTPDQFEKSHEVNQNDRQDPKNSRNRIESKENPSYHGANQESLQLDVTKHNTHKRHYVERQSKNIKRKNKHKRRKGKRDRSPENPSPFPRISKTVTNWKEFKHEAELQSTAEYLMNGPVKVLWNNNIIPLVAPSEHLTKETVFGALSIIKNKDDIDICIPQPAPHIKLDFDVYLPTTNYSRLDPGVPSHSIKVVRCKDPTPSMTYEEKVPVHYAMVDNGTITFYSFSNVKLPNYV